MRNSFMAHLRRMPAMQDSGYLRTQKKTKNKPLSITTILAFVLVHPLLTTWRREGLIIVVIIVIIVIIIIVISYTTTLKKY